MRQGLNKMPEINNKMRVVKVEYRCDECEEGNMQSTGLCLTSNPPQYPHVCDNCGHSQTFRKRKYPYVEFVLKD